MSAKRKAQRKHFARQVYVRHGLSISDYDFDQIIDQIQGDGPTFLARQSHRITLHAVTIGEKRLAVFYDTNRNVPVTVMGDNMIPPILRDEIRGTEIEDTESVPEIIDKLLPTGGENNGQETNGSHASELSPATEEGRRDEAGKKDAPRGVRPGD